MEIITASLEAELDDPNAWSLLGLSNLHLRQLASQLLGFKHLPGHGVV